MDEKCISPEILEMRRRHVDEAIEASYALQAGLITGGEWDAIADLAIDWNNYVKWLSREKETQYLDAVLERLISNGPAIIEGLRQAGYHSLTLQVKCDIEALGRRVIDYGQTNKSVKRSLRVGMFVFLPCTGANSKEIENGL